MAHQEKNKFNQFEQEYYRGRKDGQADQSFEVGWKNKQAQYVRFQQFERMFDNETELSLNDLGCGNSEYYQYFKEAHPLISMDYNGYDHMASMVEVGRERFPELSKQINVITDSSEMKECDYTVASGIFNLRFEMSDDQWRNNILITIEHMAKKSKKGFAFNALTSYSDLEFQRPELYYSIPEWLFGHCMQKYGREVSLLHDYGQFDFTIIVRF